jgi:hypothetical protein
MISESWQSIQQRPNGSYACIPSQALGGLFMDARVMIIELA